MLRRRPTTKLCVATLVSALLPWFCASSLMAGSTASALQVLEARGSALAHLTPVKDDERQQQLRAGAAWSRFAAVDNVACYAAPAARCAMTALTLAGLLVRICPSTSGWLDGC